ncbi:hypothetical protein [Thioalkalivibrio sp. XN8]|uniref:hypothetical protein n=1 Tax=Thioalkalivibrio sp. XN8 TaxID=2712863 RepID=UPI001F0FFEF3|nr:hypothetical protein [Thioalkalivibrio sp. XN8]
MADSHSANAQFDRDVGRSVAHAERVEQVLTHVSIKGLAAGGHHNFAGQAQPEVGVTEMGCGRVQRLLRDRVIEPQLAGVSLLHQRHAGEQLGNRADAVQRATRCAQDVSLFMAVPGLEAA